jgi:ankyrin repeat protein
MTLLKLPPEILLCVVDQLSCARDISSLSRAARCTSHIFQDALLRLAAQKADCPALHYAAKEDYRSNAEALLRYGTNVNAPFKSYTPLMIAARCGSESVIDLLLACEDLDINAKNPNGETALWFAAYAGNRSVVISLLRCKGISIDLADTCYELTPFAIAVTKGYGEVARDLLATGKINLNSRDRNGRTPVYHAIKSGDQELVSLLLFNREVDIDIRDLLHRTPFWYAVVNDNLLAAHLLLTRGADPNAPDLDRITPLNVAILRGHTPMLRLLLSRQEVDVAPKLDPGVLGVFCEAQPPVCLAAYKGNKQAVKMLLSRGADVNACDTLGSPLLHIAVQRVDPSMVKTLLRHRCLDVNKTSQDKFGLTALHEASRDGRLSMVNLLLSKEDIDINVRDVNGRTPLWWAARNNHPFIAKRLLAESGLDTNAASAGGSTPLHQAVNLGNRMLVLSLLAADTLDPNISTKDGLTPLGCAARNGDRKMIDLLLTREDTRISLCGLKLHSPLALAMAGGHYNLMFRLLCIALKARHIGQYV